MIKRSHITGISGLDGNCLGELVLTMSCKVRDTKSRASRFNTQCIIPLYEEPHVEHPHLALHHGDLTVGTSLAQLLQQVLPDEVYSLGDQSREAADIGSLADHWAGHDTRAKNAWNLPSPFQGT